MVIAASSVVMSPKHPVPLASSNNANHRRDRFVPADLSAGCGTDSFPQTCQPAAQLTDAHTRLARTLEVRRGERRMAHPKRLRSRLAVLDLRGCVVEHDRERLGSGSVVNVHCCLQRRVLLSKQDLLNVRNGGL